MAVRSKRLFGPTAVTTSAAPVYTCPAGETALIKHIEAGPGSIGGSTVTFYLAPVGNNRRIHVAEIPNNGWSHETGLFIVLHPGDQLHAQSSSGTVIVTAFGAELEGVAD